MESVGSIRRQLSRISKSFSLAALAHGDIPHQIRRAVHDGADGANWRSSPLPRELVLWLLLGMAIHRDLSIPNVLSRLVADLRGSQLGLPLRAASDDALAHARTRLGTRAPKIFFERMAARIDPPASFHGRRVWAIDGARINVADTPANEAAFGRPPGSYPSAYPQLHLVTLTSAAKHEVRAFRWCRVPPDERGAALALIPYLGKNDLVVLDRGLYAAWMLAELYEQQTDFLVRVPRSVRMRIVGCRGEGDYDVVIRRRGRQGRTERSQRDVEIHARMIECRIAGQCYCLVTSLTDPAITKEEIVALYRERWEAEITFKEIKCHFTAPRHARAPTHFRGRSPETVEQELWATFAAYNLVRGLMRKGAERAGVPARQMSFVGCLEVIRTSAAAMAEVPEHRLPRYYERLLDDLARCVLKRPRRNRSAPRVVKLRTKHYPPKKPGDRTRARAPDPRIHWGAAP